MIQNEIVEAMAKAHCDFFGGEGWWDAGLLADTKPKALEAMRAAIAAMTVQAEPQWQGIESAPRDGTWILVPDKSLNGFGVTAAQWRKGWVCYPRTGNTEVEGWWLHGGFYGAQKLITHWMPLPTPPAAGGSDAE